MSNFAENFKQKYEIFVSFYDCGELNSQDLSPVFVTDSKQ